MKDLIGLLRSLKERSESWERTHPKETNLMVWLSIVIFSVAIALLMYGFSVPFGLVTILSNDALKTLIEAEATILGFFGLVAVYALTSYDNRIDKIENRIEEYVEKNESKPIGYPNYTNEGAYHDRKDLLIQRKGRFTKSIIISLGCLFVSFFLSIYDYGILTIKDITVESTVSTTFPLILGAFVFLFTGILSIFVMLYGMGKEPKH